MSPVNDALILYYIFAIYTLNICIPYSGRDKENIISYIKRRSVLRPLTSLGTSARPYRVTTQYSYYIHTWFLGKPLCHTCPDAEILEMYSVSCTDVHYTHMLFSHKVFKTPKSDVFNSNIHKCSIVYNTVFQLSVIIMRTKYVSI